MFLSTYRDRRIANERWDPQLSDHGGIFFPGPDGNITDFTWSGL